MRARPMAVALLLLLAGCDRAADPGTSAPEPTREPTTESSRVDARTAERVGPRQPEAPRAVRLPSGRQVPVQAVGTRRDGLLDVPDDVRRSGWWRGGSKVGDPFGSTLIAGHVDSVEQGLGPYAELLSVERGARVVLGSAHLRQVFEVTSLRLVPRDSVRDRPVLHAVSGPRRLTLVTCAPPYDPSRGGYQRLAVVTARPVAEPVRRAAR